MSEYNNTHYKVFKIYKEQFIFVKTFYSYTEAVNFIKSKKENFIIMKEESFD